MTVKFVNSFTSKALWGMDVYAVSDEQFRSTADEMTHMRNRLMRKEVGGGGDSESAEDEGHFHRQWAMVPEATEPEAMDNAGVVGGGRGLSLAVPRIALSVGSCNSGMAMAAFDSSDEIEVVRSTSYGSESSDHVSGIRERGGKDWKAEDTVKRMNVLKKQAQRKMGQRQIVLNAAAKNSKSEYAITVSEEKEKVDKDNAVENREERKSNLHPKPPKVACCQLSFLHTLIYCRLVVTCPSELFCVVSFSNLL